MSVRKRFQQVVFGTNALGALRVAVACLLLVALAGCSLEAPATPSTQHATPPPVVVATPVERATAAPSATYTPTSLPLPTGTPRPASSRIYVSPLTTTVKPGESFSVMIMISSTEMMRGAQAGLSFDPALLEATGCEEGALIRDWAKADNGVTMLIPPKAAIDNQRGGVAVMVVAIFGGDHVDDGPRGAGSFLICLLKARPGASGQSDLRLLQAKIFDVDGIALPGLAIGGRVVVSEK